MTVSFFSVDVESVDLNFLFFGFGGVDFEKARFSSGFTAFFSSPALNSYQVRVLFLGTRTFGEALGLLLIFKKERAFPLRSKN